MFIPSPIGLSFEEWAAAIILEIPSGDLPVPLEAAWVVWGDSLWQQPALSIYGIPHPSTMSDWQTWALALMTAMGQ